MFQIYEKKKSICSKSICVTQSFHQIHTGGQGDYVQHTPKPYRCIVTELLCHVNQCSKPLLLGLSAQCFWVAGSAPGLLPQAEFTQLNSSFPFPPSFIFRKVVSSDGKWLPLKRNSGTHCQEEQLFSVPAHLCAKMF